LLILGLSELHLPKWMQTNHVTLDMHSHHAIISLCWWWTRLSGTGLSVLCWWTYTLPKQ